MNAPIRRLSLLVGVLFASLLVSTTLIQYVFAADLNAALLDPRDSTTGFASGATLSLPGIAGSTIASVTGSYFHLDGARGFIASPALEYRVGTVRIRAAYQLYRVGGAWEMTTHGADLRFSQSLFRRFDWVMQVGSRLGRARFRTKFRIVTPSPCATRRRYTLSSHDSADPSLRISSASRTLTCLRSTGMQAPIGSG